jgi:hypothetical protein
MLSSVFVWSLSFHLEARGQESVASQSTQQEQAAFLESGFFDKAAKASVFIYEAQATPCASQRAGRNLAPLGSGFVVHLKFTKEPNGWNFLITAKHVITGRSNVIIRIHSNTTDFVCYRLDLDGAIFSPSGVDLAAARLPEITGADPLLIPSYMLIDDQGMAERDIGVGTDVLTVGYLLGYDGQKIDAPIAAFARMSMVTNKRWYHNSESKRTEQAYEMDLSSALELSGAPVFAHGAVIAGTPFRYRKLQPFVLGVVKDFTVKPAKGDLISARVAILEPGANLKDLMGRIAGTLHSDSTVDHTNITQDLAKDP